MNVEERITQLEAEMYVLKGFVRALISLNPNQLNDPIWSAIRDINVSSQSMDEPMRTAIQTANQAFGADKVHRTRQGS